MDPRELKQAAFRAKLLSDFERVTELPMLILALSIIPLLLVPAVIDVSPAMNSALTDVGWFIWAAFAFEYVVRLSLTTHRWRFILREWPDLLITVLPFLRPLRIARSARALRLLRLAVLVGAVGEINEHVRRLLKGHHLHYALTLAIGVVVVCAAIVASAESDVNGNIHSFSDALWWAMTTVTTVGYGDKFPMTAVGKGVAVFLMVTGIALFGFLTANIAALLVSSDDADASSSQPTNAELLARIDELAEQLRLMSKPAE